MTADARRDARLAWVIGGSLLIAYAVVSLAANAISMMFYVPGVGTALDVIWAVALLVFAFGIRRSGSVVARQPLGVVALIVAAALPFASTMLWRLIPLETTDQLASVMIGETLRALSLAALVVATVVIGRAGAVPPRVRWVPLIVLAIVAGGQILAQVIAVSAPGLAQQAAIVGMLFGASLLGSVGILLLGVLATFFAPTESVREPAEAVVQIYPSV